MVTISYPREQTSFVAPDEKQRRALLEIVFQHHPGLRPKEPTGRAAEYIIEDPVREFWLNFDWSFYRIAHLRRAEQPDRKKAISWWASECRDWIHDTTGKVRDIGSGAYLAAALAHGDVPYIIADPLHGAFWELGLSEFHSRGKPATDKWRGVLETGQLLKATRPRSLPPPDTPIPRVTITDMTTGEDISNSKYNLWSR